MSSPVNFRVAGRADLAALVVLVHSAYRGEESRTGWTFEADLLDGQRTDLAELASIIDRPEEMILLADLDGELVGCCHLARRGDGGYFAMFAVAPRRQAGGIGTQILAEAERIARSTWGARRLSMTVIGQRQELISFYERRGYARTGESAPFPYGEERFGIPKREDLYFVVLAKELVDR